MHAREWVRESSSKHEFFFGVLLGKGQNGEGKKSYKSQLVKCNWAGRLKNSQLLSIFPWEELLGQGRENLNDFSSLQLSSSCGAALFCQYKSNYIPPIHGLKVGLLESAGTRRDIVFEVKWSEVKSLMFFLAEKKNPTELKSRKLRESSASLLTQPSAKEFAFQSEKYAKMFLL